jgi:hypothetical protein
MAETPSGTNSGAGRVMLVCSARALAAIVFHYGQVTSHHYPARRREGFFCDLPESSAKFEDRPAWSWSPFALYPLGGQMSRETRVILHSTDLTDVKSEIVREISKAFCRSVPNGVERFNSWLGPLKGPGWAESSLLDAFPARDFGRGFDRITPAALEADFEEELAGISKVSEPEAGGKFDWWDLVQIWRQFAKEVRYHKGRVYYLYPEDGTLKTLSCDPERYVSVATAMYQHREREIRELKLKITWLQPAAAIAVLLTMSLMVVLIAR